VPWLAAQELTGGRGVDVAIEALGRAATFETAWRVWWMGEGRDGGHRALGEKAGVEVTRIVRRNVSGRQHQQYCLELHFAHRAGIPGQ